MGSFSNIRNRRTFEQHAEDLVVYQTDVIAEIEHQLRAARNTIRLIETLRGAPHHTGRELTTRERRQTLETLSNEWNAIDSELTVQHEACAQIQKTISQMRERLDVLRSPERNTRAESHSERAE